jgi:uncharacterized protein DUF998
MAEAERGRTIRHLALAALVGQLIWLTFVLVGGLWEPAYSEIRDAVSFLGARDAASPWVFDAVVAISGLSLLALAVALALDAPRGLRGRLGPALIAITGLAQILDGFPFPADCRRTIDAGCHAREVAGQLSWRHYAHGWAYFFGGLALLLSVFAMAWRFHGDPRWRVADRLSLGGGAIAVVVFGGLFFFTGKGFEDHYGLVQRFALVSAIFWVGVLALALLDLYGRRRLLGARGVRQA